MATAALGGLGRLRADARAKTTRAKTRRRANARGSRAKLGALQTPVEGADGGASAGEGGVGGARDADAREGRGARRERAVFDARVGRGDAIGRCARFKWIGWCVEGDFVDALRGEFG